MGTPSRAKCCQYQDCYQLCKSSPCSSSSSSVTSQGKDLPVTTSAEAQCQTFNGYQQQQQEKSVQCGNKAISCSASGFRVVVDKSKEAVQCSAGAASGYVSPNLRTAGSGKTHCKHGVCASPSIEYVGQSGGRHVCATPPLRGSVGSVDGSVCGEQCCLRRSQNALAVISW